MPPPDLRRSTLTPTAFAPSPAHPTDTPTQPNAANPQPTPDTRLKPEQWTEWPVLPELSAYAREIFRQSGDMGVNGRAFSVVGDCQSAPEVFLGIYATDRYDLTEQYAYLQETIDFYAGSFDRISLAVVDGLNAASLLSPTWSDPEQCRPDEDPLACELGRWKPAVVFVNLGTNWPAGGTASDYEVYLRRIVEKVIASGAVPVLTTKADNIEGDHSLNLATARVAYETHMPLINVWRELQNLPGGGLDPEREQIYLTSDAWDRRNFIALQTLDGLRQAYLESAETQSLKEGAE